MPIQIDFCAFITFFGFFNANVRVATVIILHNDFDEISIGLTSQLNIVHTVATNWDSNYFSASG